MHYPFHSTGRLISHRNGWLFRVYMIPLRDFVKFSPLYKNRDELTPGWLVPAFHFVVVSCKQIQSHEREPEWTRSGANVALVSCKHLLNDSDTKPFLLPLGSTAIGCTLRFTAVPGFFLFGFTDGIPGTVATALLGAASAMTEVTGWELSDCCALGFFGFAGFFFSCFTGFSFTTSLAPSHKTKTQSSFKM